jgi:transcriptional regulator with XRE-family HTH domain
MVYNFTWLFCAIYASKRENNMNTSDLIRELCRKKGISISELARRLGQTPQNFTKKLQRETVSTDELKRIGDELGIVFEQSFTLEDGEKISVSNKS